MGPNSKPNTKDLEEIVKQQTKVINGYKELIKKYRGLVGGATIRLADRRKQKHAKALVTKEDIS